MTDESTIDTNWNPSVDIKENDEKSEAVDGSKIQAQYKKA